MAVVRTSNRLRRVGFSALFSFYIAAMAVCRPQPALADIGSTITAAPQTTSLASEPAILSRIINVNEGLGIVYNDNEHSVTRMGINSEANDLSAQKVENLTIGQAEWYYDKNYWKVMHIDRLPVDMRFPAMDAGVLTGTREGKILVAEAHNNPFVLLKETEGFCESLANKKTNKNWKVYVGSLHEWRKRNAADIAYTKEIMGMPADAPVSEMAQLSPINQTPKAAPVIAASAGAVGLVSSANAAMIPQFDTAAGARTTTLPGNPAALEKPDVVNSLPKDLPFTAAEDDIAATFGSTLVVFWAYKIMRFLAYLKNLFKPRRRRPTRYRAAEEPISVAMGKPTFAPASPENGLCPPKGYASGEQGSTGHHSSTFNPDHLTGFSKLERAAFIKTFSHHFANIETKPQGQWHVQLDDKSHVVIEPQRMTIHGAGDKQIEATLIYAADAWGGCKVSGATQDYADNMARVAHRLISEGKLPASFVMEGVPSFAAAPVPAQQSIPTKSSPFRPSSSRGWLGRNEPLLA